MKLSSIKSAAETTVSHNHRIKKKVLVANGQIAHVTNFSRAMFPPGEIANAHRHSDMTEVFFVESGEGVMVINDQPVQLEVGSCITVEPNEIHELRNTGAAELIVLYFGVQT